MTTQSSVRTLQPIIAVPADGAGWNPDYPRALDTAIQTALGWWKKQLGSMPFEARAAIAIGLLEPRAFYSDGPHTQDKLRSELAAYFPQLTGDGDGDAGLVYVIYACLSADPYACPGNVIGTSRASADGPPCLIVQSSGSLDAFALGQNPLDPNSGGRDQQTGALAHELGHALSLPHPTDSAVQAISLMWCWWNFPGCTLSVVEQAQASRFAADWQPA